MTKVISFELAKLLKLKGFKGKTLGFYFEDGEFRQNRIEATHGYYGDEYQVEYEELLENWNTPWLTRKDGNRCFGCSKSSGYLQTFSAPSIAEVVEWLYNKHGVWIFLIPQSEGAVDYRLESSEFPSLPLFILIVKYEKDLSMNEVLNSSDPSSEMFLHFDNSTEAYEAGIKYCLEKLI